MSKLDEVIEEVLRKEYIKTEILEDGFLNEDSFQEWIEFEKKYNENDIKEIAKRYAEWYAKQCLEIAALNATLHIDEGTRISKPPSIEYREYGITHHARVSSKSITNIKLPEHN